MYLFEGSRIHNVDAWDEINGCKKAEGITKELEQLKYASLEIPCRTRFLRAPRNGAL